MNQSVKPISWPFQAYFFNALIDWLPSKPSVTTTTHGVLDFEFGRKTLSPQVTTDSDTVFREESIGEGFKIVTVAVLEKILLFEKKLVRL